MRHFGSAASVAVALLVFAITPAYPESPNDQAALSGLSAG
jgi:hypothetical protein